MWGSWGGWNDPDGWDDEQVVLRMGKPPPPELSHRRFQASAYYDEISVAIAMQLIARDSDCGGSGVCFRIGRV